jgi:hypothetical protein
LEGIQKPGAGPWLAVRLGDEAFRQMAERGVRGNVWEQLLAQLACGRVGISLDPPGEGVCPLFASRRCQGATAGNLVASPGGCATLCLDLFTVEFVSPSGSLDRAGLAQAVVRAVGLGNALLDALSWPESGDRRETLQLRRLGLHLADIGSLVLRLGLDPRHQGTLHFILELVAQCAQAAVQESLRLGLANGPFPALLKQGWSGDTSEGGYAPQVRQFFNRFCVRNSQLLMISPASLMEPAQHQADVRDWSRLLPVLSCADLYSGRLPDVWSTLGPEACHELFWRIWSLGRRHRGVRAW